MAWSSSIRTLPTPPSILNVQQLSDGMFTNGQVIDFNVVLDQVVDVTLGAENPYIPIILDTGTGAKAIYVSGSGSNTLRFRYTVGSTHSDYNGITLGSSIINANSTISNINGNLNLTLNGVSSTVGIKVDGIIPKVIYNAPMGRFPTTSRVIQFVVKLNKSVRGLAKNSFELVSSAGLNASITGYKKVSDSVYHLWVTDSTTTSSYTGTVKLNIKSSVASAIQDSVNQQIETSSIGIGTAAQIEFPLTMSVLNYAPVSNSVAGGIVTIYGNNLGRVDKVLIGNVASKILYLNDSSLGVLIMPGADTSLTTLKIVRGTDTLFPVLNNGVYKVLQTSLPINTVNRIKDIGFNNPNRYSSFAMEKNGNFAIICDELETSSTGGACAFFLNDNGRNLDQKIGWRQVGQKFKYPFSTISNVAFGSAVAISANENRIAVVAKNASNGKGEILIYSFKRDKFSANAPVDSFIVLEDVIVGISAGHEFGNSIELSADGNSLLVSAPGFNNYDGVVYNYIRNVDGWVLLPSIMKPVDALGASVNFGATIALSADGEKAFITGKNDGAGKGAVWGFKLDANLIWQQIGTKITASNYTSTSYFGSSIALSANANKIIIGAYNENNGKGAVYYFKRTDNLITQVGNSIVDTTSNVSSQFGTSLSMSSNGDMFVVSAPLNHNGAFFVYGLEQDTPELLYGKINKSVDSSFGKKVLIDYEGYNLLHEVAYPNGNKNIAGLDALPRPIYRSINRNLIIKNSTDTIIAKMFNAKSVSKVVFADSIQLKYQALTDTTISVIIDSSIKQTKNRIDFRYGIQNNFSDSILIDRVLPSVKVSFNKNKPFNDTTFQAKLRFNKKITTNIVTNFPLLPNKLNGVPTARLDSVKADTVGFVYTAYFKPLFSAPIYLTDSLNNTYSDSVGNGSLPLLSTDTIVYDAVTLAPMLYTNRASLDSMLISFLVPETKAPGSFKLTFSNFSNDSLITTWVISNTYTQSGEFVVNLNDNPLSNPSIQAVLPNNSILQKGKYIVRFSYQDTLFNPKAISEPWTINLRDSLPTVYTYSPDYNNLMNLLTIKGKYFSRIDSLKIGNKIPASYTIVNDSLIYIGNKAGTRTGDLQFYFRRNNLDSDSSVLDYSYINGGINAVDTLTINKVWQKFRNVNKGRLSKIKLRLLNSSTTIDNKIILEIHKDTVVTASLDPAIKFTNPPILKSDTLNLLKNTSLTFKSFNFNDSTVILDDSTDYFIVVKQVNNAAENTFRILADINSPRTGAINVANAELQYQVATRPFVVIDTVPPSVKVTFNKSVPFNDTVFQAKLRFSEKVTTNIATAFPLQPNGYSGQPAARLDSVKVDTAGLVYTAYFKPLISGPIFFSNPNNRAFEDTAGNGSLPIISTDTIIFDKITLPATLYLGRLTTNLYNIGIQVPENITFNTLNLNFHDFVTDTIFHTWVLSNTITSTFLYDINILENPFTYPFVTAVTKAPQLQNGKYKLKLSYQDYLSNPKANSPSWDINYRDNLPTIYTYESNIDKQLDSIIVKGVRFLNIDSIKIGDSIVDYRILNDTILKISNSKNIAPNYLYLYYDNDSTTYDVDISKGGNNANSFVTIKKTWQKFYNAKKGRLRNIFLELKNLSTSIDHRMVLEIYKDTITTSSLNPGVKFNNLPIAISDTSLLFKSAPNVEASKSNQQFIFSKDTLLLEDSTNYFFVLKQLDNVESSSFQISVEQNNSRTGANNESNLTLKYNVITSPFLLMDQFPPTVKISFNKQGVFNDSVFQMKLRFSEKIVTQINNSYFPVQPNGIYGQASARLDSVKTDTAGLVYTGYFKALQSGPIFFYNPNDFAFSDVSGNIALPVPNSDTIFYDNVTIPAALYTNPIVVDSLTLDYNIPEKIGAGSAKLTFTNLATGNVEVTWNLKDSIQRLSYRNVNPFSDPILDTINFPFVRSVTPSNARLTYGNYRIKLVYQDSLMNPAASSPTWDIRIISQMPIVYDYTPEVNSKYNDLYLKGINFSFVDSVKINNKKVVFTSLTDSTLTIIDKSSATTGYIQFYFQGDSTHLDFTKIYGAINASTQYTINKTWQKFFNNYKGALHSIKLKLLNNSSTIDNKLVLEIYKDTIATASLDPSQKFNNQPMIISDTLNLLRNSTLSEKQFNFFNAPVILNDSTYYYFVLKQINQVGVSTSKVIGETTNLKNGAINELYNNLYYEIALKPYIYMDTIPPVANLVMQNPNKLVSGPFYVDIVFNEPVNDLTPNQLPLIPAIRNNQPTATADSLITILPNLWYRQYFTPLQLGKILVFNVNSGVTKDLAGNNALPIGLDSVFYIGNDFKLSDIDLPYSRSGNTVRLSGKGFNYLDLIKFNNQVISDTVLNDSTIEITVPSASRSGKLVLYNQAGDSTNNKLTILGSTGTSFARTDTSFIKFIPTHTGVVDSLQFYFNNANSNSANYFVEIYDHNGNKVYKRKIAISDTVQVIGNAVQKKINFYFRNHNYVVLKDSTYYIKLNQIGTLPNTPTILTGSSGQVKYNYAVNGYILIKDAGLNVTVSNNSINGKVDGSYYIDILFDRPLRYANIPLMLPGIDSTGQILARVDSTVISDDGLRYRQYVTPLKKGKIIFFNADFGYGIDFYGMLSPPFGLDTVTYSNVKKPIILSYDKEVVASGRVIQVVGKYLSNTKTVKVNNINASFYVKNEDTLIFISPLNAGSGSIKLLNENNESITNFVDTFYNNATTYSGTTNSWQKMIMPRSGLLSNIGMVLNNTSTNNVRFNLKIYKSINLLAQNFTEKFDSILLTSDTVSVVAGSNGIVNFNFNSSKYIVSKDSNYYFVVNKLDNISGVQIQFVDTITNNGSVAGNAGNIKHTLEVQPYLLMDTLNPVPTLIANKPKTAGAFSIDLNFSEPIINLSNNPIIVNPGLDSLPKARLDSVMIIESGKKYRYYYTPKSDGDIIFSIPFMGIASDIAGNVTTLATPLVVKYIDTNYNNKIRATGDLNICSGDSLSLFSTVDSAFSIKWNTGDTTRRITVKKSGQYYFKIFVNETTDFNSDTLQVKVNELPVIPTISRNKDSLISSAQSNNIWYKNKTQLETTSQKIIPTSSDTFYVKSSSNNCSSSLSAPYIFKYINFNSLSKITTQGATKFCKGDSVLLKFINDSAYKIKWNTGATTNQITVKEAGQYFVQIFIDSNYSHNSDTVLVNVNSYPTRPILSRIGDSLVSSSFYGNKWYKNSVKMTDTIRSIKPAVSDYYTVQVDLNNCPSPVSTVYYYLVTNIIDVNNNDIAIIPNPFTDYVTINYNKSKGQQVQLDIIQLSDGLRVHTQPLIESSSKIYLNKFISGIYLFNLIDNKGKIIAQYKMVKL